MCCSGKLNQAVRTIRAFKKRIKACQVKQANLNIVGFPFGRSLSFILNFRMTKQRQPFSYHYFQNHKAAGLKSEPNIPNGQSLDEAIEELELAIR